MGTIGDTLIVLETVSEPGEGPMGGLYTRIWERPRAERGAKSRLRVAAMLLRVARRLAPVDTESRPGYRPLVASDG